MTALGIMLPEDDPTWPFCKVSFCQNFRQLDPVGHGDGGWCEHVRDILVEGKDAERFYFGMRVCVPVVPTHKLYAELSIGIEEIIPGVLGSLSLVIQKNSTMFSSDDEFISLGMWTLGEGRLVMANALNQWVLSQVEDVARYRCEDKHHSFANEMAFQKDISDDPESFQVRAHRWTAARYKQCFRCYTADVNPTINNPAAVFNPDGFTGSDFGMDQVGTPRSGSNNYTNRRKQGAADILRNRFGGQ